MLLLPPHFVSHISFLYRFYKFTALLVYFTDIVIPTLFASLFLLFLLRLAAQQQQHHVVAPVSIGDDGTDHVGISLSFRFFQCQLWIFFLGFVVVVVVVVVVMIIIDDHWEECLIFKDRNFFRSFEGSFCD